MQVSFLIKSVKGEQVVQPQHAFLRLDDASQGLQAYVVAKAEKKSTDGRLHATITHSVLEKQIGQQVQLTPALLLRTLLGTCIRWIYKQQGPASADRLLPSGSAHQGVYWGWCARFRMSLAKR